MRILVVEDEKRIADFLCRGLQGAGYAVDAALTATTAMSQHCLCGARATQFAIAQSATS